MPVVLVSEVWNEIKRYISPVDKTDAAETLVSILIDNDVDVEDIKQKFRGDSDIRSALAQYIDEADEDFEENTEDYDNDSYS